MRTNWKVVGSAFLLACVCGCGKKPDPRQSPTIVTSALPDGFSGRPYSLKIEVEKGSPPYTWSLRDVPEALGWLTIDPATGELGGTPTVAVQPGATLTIAVSDVIHRADSRTLALAVRSGPLIVTDELPDAFLRDPYAAVVTEQGGTPPFTWSLRDMPAALSWLTIDAASGALAGTPDAVVEPGAAFTVAVSDAFHQEDARVLTLAARECTEGEQVACWRESDVACMAGVRTCAGRQLGACSATTASTSTDHCGGLCTPCATGTNQTATCVGGACQFACDAGFCPGTSGCNAPLGTADNCSQCGDRCTGGTVCDSSRRCRVPCGSSTCSPTEHCACIATGEGPLVCGCQCGSSYCSPTQSCACIVTGEAPEPACFCQ